MKAIACIQENPQTKEWGIGYKNALLFHFKDDMKLFKQHTIGNICIMGRKTFESLPAPLSDRVNIILTSDKNYHPYRDGIKNQNAPIIVVNSYEELFKAINKIKQDLNWEEDNCWVIGGEQIYKHLLPYCNECIITSVWDQPVKKADAFFPNLDILDNWTCGVIQASEKDPIVFIEYINKEPKEFNL